MKEALPPQPSLRFADTLLAGAVGARKSDRTRARLQAAVCDLLEEAIPATLRVDQVCEKAGTSHGTFYVYFPDIDTLLTRTLAEYVAYLESSLLLAGKVAQDRPRAVTRAYVDLFEANRGLMRCLVSRAGDLPEANALFEAMNRRWAELVADAAIRHAIAEGHPAPDKEEILRRAYLVCGMVDQYLITLFFGTDATLAALSQDREKLVSTFSTLWTRGLAP
jgi:AcrR family transcriptional regulator